MKLISKFLLIIFLLFIFCSCSHSTSIQRTEGRYGGTDFTLNNKDFLKKIHIKGLRLRLAPNAMINVDIRTIADFVHPIGIGENHNLGPNDINMQPWALCNILF